MNKTAMQAITIIMVMAMVATSLVAVMSSDVSAEEQSYDVDMGKKYSMQTHLIWDGKDAESVHYEIVDATGNPVTSSDEWNLLITWPAPGVYYITQTAHNSYNGGSDTTTVYRVEIMGYPEIHFETNVGLRGTGHRADRFQRRRRTACRSCQGRLRLHRMVHRRGLHPGIRLVSGAEDRHHSLRRMGG